MLVFRRVYLLEESERRSEELERVTESHARLMRGFSHDVRDPLGADRFYACFLRSGGIAFSRLWEWNLRWRRQIIAASRAGRASCNRILASAVGAGYIRVWYTRTNAKLDTSTGASGGPGWRRVWPGAGCRRINQSKTVLAVRVILHRLMTGIFTVRLAGA